ncbi:hypothetical protein M885DRAFT_539870 [Pelagophyceae sp. CCMP2097]|nr:hypothetical protein M885DRAFT_539870 [Pelagophyceae sp. CCMP2097]
MQFSLASPSAARARPPQLAMFTSAAAEEYAIDVAPDRACSSRAGQDAYDDDASAARKRVRGDGARRGGCESESALRLKDEATAFAEAGDFPKALPLFDSAIATAPHDAALHELRAQVLLALARPREASAAALEATRLDATCAANFLTLGRALYDCGEPHCASEAFARCLGLDADHEEAKEELDRAERLVNRADQEHEDFMRRSQASDDPQHAEVLRCKAHLALRVSSDRRAK